MATRSPIKVDDFEAYADGDLTEESAGFWEDINPLSCIMKVTSGAVHASHVGAGQARYTHDYEDVWIANQYAGIEILKNDGTGQIGPAVRVDQGQDASRTLYYSRFDDGANTLAIGKIITGTISILTSESQSPTNGVWVWLEAEGDGLRCYLDDVEELSTTDTSIEGDNTFMPGLHASNAGGIRASSWEGGNLEEEGGAEDFEATGDLDAQSATVAGTATVGHAATGALAAQSVTIAGTVTVNRAASGALEAQSATINGEGTSSSQPQAPDSPHYTPIIVPPDWRTADGDFEAMARINAMSEDLEDLEEFVAQLEAAGEEYVNPLESDIEHDEDLFPRSKRRGYSRRD
jgi:hypothetical protein